MINKIPKKIHYIWVGPKERGPLIESYIESWRKYLHDYEIVFWSEENFPDRDHHYFKKMYENGKWAFVSDYMRFWILYNKGGIYLDTDMEVLRPFDKKFLEYEIFFGKAGDSFISCGIIGSVKGNPFVEKVLHFYDNDREYRTLNTSPRIVTDIYREEKNKEKIKIFPREYFYPCSDGEKCPQEMLSFAYTNHHWAESWVRFGQLRKVLRRLRILSLLKVVFKFRI